MAPTAAGPSPAAPDAPSLLDHLSDGNFAGVTATMQARMSLHLFPFDVQDLPIDLATYWELNHPLTPVLLVKNQNEVRYTA